MAMTDYSIDIVNPPIEGGWTASSQYCADIDDAFDLVAASTGKCHYVRKIIMNCGTVSSTFTLGADVVTNALVHTYIGPISFGIAAGTFEFDLGEKAMKIPASHSFTIDGTSSTPVWIYFEYKTV